METINNTQTVKVEETQSTVEQKNDTSNNVNTNNVIDLNKVIFNNRNVTPHILLDHFKGMLSNDKIVFYDKRGVKNEFDNSGISSRKYVHVEDKRKEKRTKFVVVMKTYLHLMGDLVVMEWDNGEVRYTTKLNHEDLQNWSEKMYWKGTYSQVQTQLQAQTTEQTPEQTQVQTQVQTSEQTPEQTPEQTTEPTQVQTQTSKQVQTQDQDQSRSHVRLTDQE